MNPKTRRAEETAEIEELLIALITEHPGKPKGFLAKRARAMRYGTAASWIRSGQLRRLEQQEQLVRQVLDAAVATGRIITRKMPKAWWYGHFLPGAP